MAAAGSSARKTAVPATNVSAPASAARSIVSGLIPPSTWIQMSRSRSSMTLRARRIFSSIGSMNDWPPNPGSTVMTSSMSSSGRTGRNGSRSVVGLSAIAERDPRRRSSRARRIGALAASAWNVTLCAPASA